NLKQGEELGTLQGTIVREEGELVTNPEVELLLYGFAYPDSNQSEYLTFRTHLSNGHFTFEAPPGIYILQASGGAYIKPNRVDVEIEAGKVAGITLTQTNSTARVINQIVDGRTQTSISAEVEISMSSSEYGTYQTSTHSNDGRTSYDLPTGEWTFESAELFGGSEGDEWVLLHPPFSIQSKTIISDTVLVTFPAFKRDATISGTIRDSTGVPEGQVELLLRGKEELSGVFLKTKTNDYGHYSLTLPHGEYEAVLLEGGATYQGNPSHLSHEIFELTLQKDETRNDVDFFFALPDRTLKITVYADGYTKDHLVFMRLESVHSFIKGYTTPPFTLVSDGKNAVGQTTIPMVDGYRQFYMWGYDDRVSGPLAKSIINVNGDTAIVIRIDTPPEDFSWRGDSVDFDTQKSVTLNTPEGASAEIPAGAVPGQRSRQVWMTADTEQVLITEEYTLLAYQYLLDVYTTSVDFTSDHWKPTVKFTEPITVTLPYDLSIFGDAVSPEDLRISLAYGQNAHYNNYIGSLFEWDYRPDIIVPELIDIENQTVTFNLEEEGTFGIVIPSDRMEAILNFSGTEMYLPVVQN
ncbi:MAG: carboxypeptidase-like regulatory domain-containing protein, partial [Chloroflexota bacterium]